MEARIATNLQKAIFTLGFQHGELVAYHSLRLNLSGRGILQNAERKVTLKFGD